LHTGSARQFVEKAYASGARRTGRVAGVLCAAIGVAAFSLTAAPAAVAQTQTAGTSSASLRPAAPAAHAPQLLAHTRDGWLKGTVSKDSREFLGIPYAAPPVDNLRFAPPHPVRPWTGVRSATVQGSACIQFQPSGVRNSQATSEDCLYLDIYTPAGARPGSHLPVVFWMHGGGFTQGTGVIYGGQRFASLTNSIFVSINYRLGAYGYLALPQLETASRLGSGDYGLLDQIAALRWVKANIAAFGGNEHNITIDGQSAGALAVCDMLASPMARGMFQRAIIESGPCNLIPALPLAQAEALGQKFAAAVGCSDPSAVVTCLRNAWTPNLVAAEQSVTINLPVSGTPVLPVDPEQAILSGKWNKVPVIVGGVRSENKLFLVGLNNSAGQANLTAAQYVAAIQSQFGSNAAAVLVHYPVSHFPAPFYALAAVGTDSGLACDSYSFANQVAKQVPTWEEEFNDPTSPTLFGFQPPGIDMSNAHSAELAYLWNFTLGERPLTTREFHLGKQMDRHWGAFARTANPNVAGQVAWPRVTAGTHPVIDFRPSGNTVSATVFPTEHQCGFWATIEPQT
jgi:para-nitrobenzyl esterase